MKRIWISLVIFVLLIGAGITGNRYTSSVCTQIIQTVSEAKSAEQRGETDAAVELSRKAVQDWKAKHRGLCTFMPHAKLEAIGQTLAGLPMLGQYGAREEFLADCDRSIEQLSYLNETETPNIANIF